MHRTLVVDVVGLTPELVGEHTPNLLALAQRGKMTPLSTAFPAVTCTAQSNFVTGKRPSEHGIVGNGWYFRDLSEVWFWRQSNRLVTADKVWDFAKRRDPEFSCAKLFWWYNMYASADLTVTPRPMYPADGRKIPDVYAQPPDLRDELSAKLGQFPLFRFWGPAADITSSRWISDSALHIMKTRDPTLTLVYLPHLDYNLQRLGPSPKNTRLQRDLSEVDALCGELFEQAEQSGRRVVVLSEYGITEVSDAVHINRALREAGYLKVREEMGTELLDAGISDAFAVVDHQVAHVYVQKPEILNDVQALVEGLDGVERVLGHEGKAEAGLDHSRSGELVAVTRADRWFSYYYWLDVERAPDFATTVDIHRKPGYDPVELFLDPELVLPKLSVAWRLAKKGLGMRTLMDVISPDAVKLVKGSHGRLTDRPEQGPLFISDCPDLVKGDTVDSTEVRDLLLSHVFDD